LLLFTTTSYNEPPFISILSEILGDYTMLDSRANPAVPCVFAVKSKISWTPTHLALFRNFNYNVGELPESFLLPPKEARESLGLGLDMEDKNIILQDYPRQPARQTVVTPRYLFLEYCC
jgi:hypothetical protein